MDYRTEGIVLQKHKVSNDDVIITVFTRYSGKIRLYASGARNPRSRLSAGSHPFMYCEFQIQKRKDMDQLNGIEIKESFYSLREDMMRLSYGSYFLESVSKALEEQETNNRLFDFLLMTLHLLSADDIDFEVLRIVFELKLLHFLGFKPEVNHCISCGVGDNLIGFSVSEGGAICSGCLGHVADVTHLKPVILTFIHFVLKSDYRTILKTKVSHTIKGQTEQLLERYYQAYVYDKPLKSLAFLKNMKAED